MRSAIESMVAYRRGVASRFSCLPALVVFEFMAISAADRRTAIEGWLLSAICVIHGVRPTLLGWAVVLNLFALATAATIELSLRPGNPASRAWQSLALLPLTVLALLVFRPRIEAGERFACALALLIGFAGMWPLFAVWTR